MSPTAVPPPFPIDLDDIRTAAAALGGVIERTPLIENAAANQLLGGRLLIKAESLQETGAFKIRGAYWRICQMTADQRAIGTITYSSGNHALGLARAAQLLNTSALIVMPSDAIATKVHAVESLGAEVTFYERGVQDYNDVVEDLRQQTGRTHVPPSADPMVLAGSGTAALELFEQAADLDASLDAILIPCGGGGLTASTAIVAHELGSTTEVYAVEPEQFDDTRRSLAAREPVPNPPGRRTICDAIMTPKPNNVTFPINLALLAGGLVVSDDEVRDAMRFVAEHFDLIIEPGAAVGVAAVMAGQIEITGRTIATVATGGNISPERFAELTGAEPPSG